MSLSGYITLDEAKGQVSIEVDNTVHDERLTRLLDAAEKAAINFLNIDSLADLEESPVSSPATIPEDVKSGILLFVEMEFDRDEKNFELLQKRAEQLLWPYRQGLEV